MRCEECREEIAAYMEGLLEEETARAVEAHVSGCSGCAAELAGARMVTDELERDARGESRASLEAVVMGRIDRERTRKVRSIKMRRRYAFLGMGGSLAAGIALVLAFWFGAGNGRAEAAEVLARGAAAIANLRSIRIKCLMRTPAADNFSVIISKHELVPVELWKEFRETPRWRIEKPARVAVRNEKATVMCIDNRIADSAPPCDGFDTGWFHQLAAVDEIIAREREAALAKGWELTLSEEKAASGARQRVVTVEAKSGLGEDDYLRNKLFMTADSRRVYRFDAETGRLEGFEVTLHERDGDVVVLKVTEIAYNPEIDASVFTLELPEGVVWVQEPTRLPDNEKYEKMTPAEAARAFFEACGKEDWEEVQKFMIRPVDDHFKEYLGGVEIMTIGEAFQSGFPYPGWFVPYEIRFKSGYVKKWNLALKRHPQTNRFYVDGGL